jgi:hypothetical protein
VPVHFSKGETGRVAFVLRLGRHGKLWKNVLTWITANAE